jgi:hypothetical protein
LPNTSERVVGRGSEVERAAPPASSWSPPAARRVALALGLLALAAAAFDLSLARNHLLGVTGDDAYYLTLAQALATGHGFVVLNLPWAPPETSVPPGFPAILAPLVALTSDRSQVLRVVPFVFGVLAAPLTYTYLRQLGLRSALALAGAALVGLDPALGLYATIVAPETAFVCALLAMLICVDRWRRAPALSPWGAGAVAAALAVFELKLAAVLLLGPLVGFLFVVARRRRHALVLAAALALAALPLLAVRLASGTSPIGTSYEADFGNAYGGLHGAALVPGVAGTAARNLVALLYPTLVETVTGLAPTAPGHGVASLAGAAARDGLLALLTLAMLSGAALLWRRTRDAGAAIAPAYLLLVTAFPIMNTRRAILVLPVLVAWLLLGLAEGWRLAARAPVAPRTRRWTSGVAVLMAAAVVLPTAAVDVHLWRDYRSDWGVKLLPDRPWVRYLDQTAPADPLVETYFPRQLFLATGLHADSSLWLACIADRQRGGRASFDRVLARLRPDYVASAGNNVDDCVPALISGDPEYRQAFVDRADGVIVWVRAG